MTFGPHMVIILRCFKLSLLDAKQLTEDGPLEAQEAQEMTLVCGELCESRVSLAVKAINGDVVALDDASELLNHGLGMRLRVALVVLKVIHVVVVPRTIHFHGLQENDKLIKVWCPVDAEDV